MEEWDLGSWCTHLFDLLLGEESVLYSVSILDLTIDRDKVTDGGDESFNRLSSHVEQSILHHEPGLGQELLQFTLLIRFS